MKRYRVGDRVRLLTGSGLDHFVGGWYCDTMGSAVGQIAQITRATYDSAGYLGYHIVLESGIAWTWDARCVEAIYTTNGLIVHQGFCAIFE